MNFEVIATEPFERKAKRLAKKYRSLHDDLLPIIEQLSVNPTLGVLITENCYKIRFAITSKGKGKSGGGRLVTYVKVVKNTVYLIDIYDKSDQSNISDKELELLLRLLSTEDE